MKKSIKEKIVFFEKVKKKIHKPMAKFTKKKIEITNKQNDKLKRRNNK